MSHRIAFPNIQIGTAVQGPEMFLCPNCSCLNGMSDAQRAQYTLAPVATVFKCVNCYAEIAFHKGSEKWEVRG